MLFYFMKVLFEAITDKSSRSFRANRFDIDLSADVTALDLNLALVQLFLWTLGSA